MDNLQPGINQYLLENLIDIDDDKFIRWIYLKSVKTKYMITINGDVIHIKKKSKKILKHHLDKDGYHHVNIYINGKGYYCSVHRLVATAFIPNPDNKEQVNHKDGDKDHNYVSNLEWASPQENIRHAFMTGLSTAKKGSSHPNSVYSEEQIRKVCEYLSENKKKMKEISKLTGVSYTVIKQIRNHIIWCSISCEYNFDDYNCDDRNKYNKDQIDDVCKMISSNEYSMKEISEKTKVAFHTIYSIYKGKIWKSISKKYDFSNYTRK